MDGDTGMADTGMAEAGICIETNSWGTEWWSDTIDGGGSGIDVAKNPQRKPGFESVQALFSHSKRR